jgi:multidrug efflux system membrane fusion protein
MPLNGGKKPSGKTFRWFILAVLVSGGVATYGIIDRNRSDTALTQWTQDQAIPSVDLVTPKHATEVQQLVLPADIEAFYTAPIHARVSGYVKMWYFDIGAKVKTGDILEPFTPPLARHSDSVSLAAS